MSPIQRSSPYVVPTHFDRYNLVVVVALSAITITAFSLSLHYGLHSIGPMVQLAPNFSITVPLFVCSVTGTVCALGLLIQLVHGKVKLSFTRTVGQIVRNILHPGFQQPFEGRHVNEIAYRTSDGLTLSGIWQLQSIEAPTVILFHGNMMSAYDMSRWAHYYRHKGYNVLRAEYRGYARSEGQAALPTQEIDAHKDAEAALNFVLSQGIDRQKVIAHGLSLGGAYAAILGRYYGVEHLILNHTFTSYQALLKSKKLVDMAYQSNERCDGWNTLEKIREISGEIFVIRGEEDWLIPMRFGEELIEAKYGETREDRIVTISGGHGNWEGFFSDEPAKSSLDQFLAQRVGSD